MNSFESVFWQKDKSDSFSDMSSKPLLGYFGEIILKLFSLFQFKMELFFFINQIQILLILATAIYVIFQGLEKSIEIKPVVARK